MEALRIRYLITATVLCALVIVLGAIRAQAQESNKIVVSGSRYMYFTVTDLARYFGDKNPNSNIVVSATDSDTGFRKFLDREIDVLMSFRILDEDEKADAAERGLQLMEQMVGYGAVAIVTQPENPVRELTLDQVRKMFIGELTNWNQVGGPNEPIIPMTRDESISGTEIFFRELVLKGPPLAPSLVRVCEYDIIRAVWKQKGAIADARFVEATRGKSKGMVKIIPIKENDNTPHVAPTEETVKNRTYPICGPLYIYHDAKSGKPYCQKFMEFCFSQGLWPVFALAR